MKLPPCHAYILPYLALVCQDERSMTQTKFISITEFAKKHNIPRHRILSWVRRGLYGRLAKKTTFSKIQYGIAEDAPLLDLKKK